MSSINWSTGCPAEIAAWNAAHHFSADLEAVPLTNEQFRYQTAAATDGAVFIARSRGSGDFHVHRSSAHVRSSHTRVCTLYFPMSGEISFMQDGSAGTARPDDFFLLHGDSPFNVASSADVEKPWEALFVTVPSDLMLDTRVLVRDTNAILFHASGVGELARIAFQHILECSAGLSPESLRRLTRSALEIVSEAIRISGGGRARQTLADAQRERLERCIEDSLSDQGLTAADVAGRCGISRRYLHLLMSGNATRFSRYLWERRLARAASLLKDPHVSHWTIERLAADCGFRSASHFSRLYSSRHGETPRQTRSRCTTDRLAAA
jgi:AraC-like DNA-binding protein